jgi:hypothetical protein
MVNTKKVNVDVNVNQANMVHIIMPAGIKLPE